MDANQNEHHSPAIQCSSVAEVTKEYTYIYTDTRCTTTTTTDDDDYDDGETTTTTITTTQRLRQTTTTTKLLAEIRR